jgi:hypothetical protein
MITPLGEVLESTSARLPCMNLNPPTKFSGSARTTTGWRRSTRRCQQDDDDPFNMKPHIIT